MSPRKAWFLVIGVVAVHVLSGSWYIKVRNTWEPVLQHEHRLWLWWLAGAAYMAVLFGLMCALLLRTDKLKPMAAYVAIDLLVPYIFAAMSNVVADPLVAPLLRGV